MEILRKRKGEGEWVRITEWEIITHEVGMACNSYQVYIHVAQNVRILIAAIMPIAINVSKLCTIKVENFFWKRVKCPFPKFGDIKKGKIHCHVIKCIPWSILPLSMMIWTKTERNFIARLHTDIYSWCHSSAASESMAFPGNQTQTDTCASPA